MGQDGAVWGETGNKASPGLGELGALKKKHAD